MKGSDLQAVEFPLKALKNIFIMSALDKKELIVGPHIG